MVTSVTVLVLVLAIAFYHFTEGFFSALISAISAVLAGVLAVSYCEPVVTNVFHGGMADCAHSISLVLLFLIAYIVIRMIFDKLIPGNVRTPATLDKVGGALMGLVAGTFAIGIFVIALQMLPYGPAISFFGYARFPVAADRHVYVHHGGNTRDDDSVVHDQLTNNSLVEDAENNKELHLLLPADDLVMNTVYRLSDGGSLAGGRTLASIHPDWLGELFAQRLGEQTGSRRSALATATNQPISVPEAYRGDNLGVFDGYGEVKRLTPPDLEIRPMGYKQPFGGKLAPSKGGMIPIVLRIKVRASATDDFDKLFRFSPAQIRLVARGDANEAGDYRTAKDYYPVGFLEGDRLVTNRLDDFMFMNTGDSDGFDAVFMVDKSVLVGGKNKTNQLAPGTFIIVKRLANIDLGGLAVSDSFKPDDKQKLIRSESLKTELHPDPH